MKIIVTGGAGFIGSHVVDAYVKAGHRVIIIDDLSTGFRRNLNPRAKFYKADIRNQRLLEIIFRKEEPEVVNHHAALASVIASIKNPNETFEVNVSGTANLLRAFGTPRQQAGESRNPKKFIMISTGGAMYGTPKKLPVSEKIPPCPLSPYGLSKLLAEETVQFYARAFYFPYTILRYANVYGPRQNPHGEAGVVAIFQKQMKEGVPPTIFGDGTKSRDYVYVGDIAAANLVALRKGTDVTLNLGWGKKISDNMIFTEVARACGFKGKPRYAPYRKGEVYQIALDASRAKKILGWKPIIPLRKGIERTVLAL
ncbi:MAG: NAD-dependent epimerase/dehydratase family protein [Candidatus Liptonbacteria bacterium]|nr:NAD-dependent epimerase/dehydratase family protein [Candidatus Liptonbacteria bacterium]